MIKMIIKVILNWYKNLWYMINWYNIYNWLYMSDLLLNLKLSFNIITNRLSKSFSRYHDKDYNQLW